MDVTGSPGNRAARAVSQTTRPSVILVKSVASPLEDSMLVWDAVGASPRKPVGLGAEERRLVARLREGDERAVEELYVAYRKPIFGFLVRLARDRYLAEDLFHARSSVSSRSRTAWPRAAADAGVDASSQGPRGRGAVLSVRAYGLCRRSRRLCVLCGSAGRADLSRRVHARGAPAGRHGEPRAEHLLSPVRRQSESSLDVALRAGFFSFFADVPFAELRRSSASFAARVVFSHENSGRPKWP